MDVVNYEPTDSEGYKETAFMDEAAADANLKAGRAAVSVLDSAVDGLPPNASTLDVTDRVLEDLLATSHFLFTNGDYFRSPTPTPRCKHGEATCFPARGIVLVLTRARSFKHSTPTAWRKEHPTRPPNS